MSQEGRGGPPHSGFIGKSLSGELHDNNDNTSTSSNEQRHGNGATATALGEVGGIGPEDSLIVVRDLRKSGLEPKDMEVRVLDMPERAMCGIPARGEGYVIPYYDISGTPLPFYRARILNADYATNGIRYKQPRRTPNHIYFPKDFKSTLTKWGRRHPYEKFLIITEGEKKAVCAAKYGFPSIALSGVESWRSRTIILPEDTEFYTTNENADNNNNQTARKGPIKARLPSTDSSVPELVTLARGFGDMIDLITQFQLYPVLVYDSDRLGTIKAEVQRAATMLAYELVYLGIHANRVKQIILPAVDEKTGLDDFIMANGPDAFEAMVLKVLQDPRAFPRHPNPKGFISTLLQNRMSRKSMQQCASMILTELDAQGERLMEKVSGAPYYYDRDSAHLIRAIMLSPQGRPLHETHFGTLLYRKFGISAADNRILIWLASQFTGEEPIYTVTPRRSITLITEKEDPFNPHGIALQVSDSQFLAISPHDKEPVKLLTNGSLGILFEQDQVEPLDVDLCMEYFEHQLSEAKEAGYLESWWQDILGESNIGLQPDTDATIDDQGLLNPNITYTLPPRGQAMRQYATLLFYISPFLLRWRGLQLPIELTVGGPGSGKSSLYSLRLQILTGRPKLRNIPSDIKDFYATLANAGGLLCIDNVHFLNKELRQRISDELCRITTEPNPTVEMRKLYTETDQVRVPVNATFAFTSIQPAFHNEDLIQRSISFHTQPSSREPKGDWVNNKIEEKGGREAWVAHHLVFLHLFLKQEWNDDFRTKHRLAHLEQAMTLAQKVLNLRPVSLPQQVQQAKQTKPTSTHPAPLSPPLTSSSSSAGIIRDLEGPVMSSDSSLGNIMFQNQAQQLLESDWVMQGIKAFADLLIETRRQDKRFFMADIAEFCILQEQFQDNEILINARKLGRYAQERSVLLSQAIGVNPAGLYGNRMSYRLVKKQ